MADKSTILIVDDEEDFCQTVSDILTHSGYHTIVRKNPVEALELLQVENVDLVLLDILMPQMDGRQVLSEIVQNHPEIPVIMITGQAYNVPVAIETAKKGSFSFLAKPIDLVQLRESVKQAIESKRPKVVSHSIEEVMREVGIVAVSKQIEQIMGMAERVAKTTVPVLVTGESGVGKEVLARAIHKLSLRQEKPFVSVDCGTLTETLLESELFGHVKGAFTGALTDKKGLFEIADGGTIFLDEIGNTTVTFQQKLLNVLNNSKVRRVGDTHEREVDVRVISATNKNLPELIGRGDFREDLYYRLNKYDIHVPPLRDRVDDIPPLIRFLLSRACREHNLTNHYFSPAAFDLMARQEWRGNVRELDSVVTKLAIFAESEEIDVHTVAHALKAERQPQTTIGYQIDRRPLMDQVEEFEKRLIIEALRANNGNQTRAAEQLGVERTNFVKKMRKHNLQKDDFN
ncbi:MAG: sigma-54 dependent transcriptional regulator [Bacteroidota bacterium]|jgi:two-component system nitrogen regulation response regulator NtrX|nr:sigma-54 dependent transcriptional regulator [Bacteroidota bacterium]